MRLPNELAEHLERPAGHAHFWERALSRRELGRAALGATVAAVAARPLVKPLLSFADAPVGGDPKPIPGGLGSVGGSPGLYHLNLPMPSDPNDPSTIPDQSTIYDFNGLVAVAEVQGTGTGTQMTPAGATEIPFVFDVDMRVMQGLYVGFDGRRRRGTFGFI